MFHVSSTAALHGAGSTEPAIAAVVVNHDDRASPEVLPVAPRQPLQRHRVFSLVFLVRVGVIRSVQAVNHDQVVLAGGVNTVFINAPSLILNRRNHCMSHSPTT